MTLLVAVFGLILWVAIGMCVMAEVDAKDRRLLEWIDSAPHWGLKWGCLVLWPVVVWKFLH